MFKGAVCRCHVVQHNVLHCTCSKVPAALHAAGCSSKVTGQLSDDKCIVCLITQLDRGRLHTLMVHWLVWGCYACVGVSCTWRMSQVVLVRALKPMR